MQLKYTTRVLLSLALSLSLVSSVCADITSNLVGHWTFNENTGTTAANTGSVGSQTCTFNHASPWVTFGKTGPGMVTSHSTSDYGSVPYAAGSALTSTGSSVAFWIYLNSYVDGCIFSRTGVNLQGFRTEASPPHLYLTCDGFNKSELTAAVTVGSWHHVCVTVDAGGNAIMYVDGVGIDAFVITGSTWFTEAGLPYRFGAPSATFFTSGLSAADMKLDDVRLYTRALASGDVTELRKWGLNGTQKSRVTNSGGLGGNITRAAIVNQ